MPKKSGMAPKQKGRVKTGPPKDRRLSKNGAKYKK